MRVMEDKRFLMSRRPRLPPTRLIQNHHPPDTVPVLPLPALAWVPHGLGHVWFGLGLQVVYQHQQATGEHKSYKSAER